MPEIISEAAAADQTDAMDSPPPEPAGDNPNQLPPHESKSEIGVEQLDTTLIDAPAFLQRTFGSRMNAPRRSSTATSDLFAFIAKKRQSLLNIFRQHFIQDVSIRRTERPIRQIGGIAFSLLSLLTVVACLFAAFALGQIGSLKSEIASLRRELLPLKAGLGKLELAENTRRESEQDGKNAGTKESRSERKPATLK